MWNKYNLEEISLENKSELTTNNRNYSRKKSGDANGCEKLLPEINHEKTHTGEKHNEFNKNGSTFYLNEDFIQQERGTVWSNYLNIISALKPSKVMLFSLLKRELALERNSVIMMIVRKPSGMSQILCYFR